MNHLLPYQALPQRRIFPPFVQLQLVTNLAVIQRCNTALYHK